MVEELIREDGMCVMSAGMGWQKAVAVVLRLHMERRRCAAAVCVVYQILLSAWHADDNPAQSSSCICPFHSWLLCRDATQQGVVLVLGCTDWQRSMLYRELHRMNESVPYAAADPALSDQAAAPNLDADGQPNNRPVEHASDLLMPFDVTNEVSAAGRIDLYRTKPCLFVTTRILVVDMLNARIQGQHIAGMVIMNAHRVTDASGEAFAVRLFRMANKRGFIRAFSDQPTGFASGFNKVWPCHYTCCNIWCKTCFGKEPQST